jgi:hypothetical protein
MFWGRTLGKPPGTHQGGPAYLKGAFPSGEAGECRNNSRDCVQMQMPKGRGEEELWRGGWRRMMVLMFDGAGLGSWREQLQGTKGGRTGGEGGCRKGFRLTFSLLPKYLTITTTLDCYDS